ncbi:MAG: 16S rRNA (adenine(1518)-N(6)/adenine(1519)-N(6))-dimethyltransferase RsmA [Gemmataceae bacterium]
MEQQRNPNPENSQQRQTLSYLRRLFSSHGIRPKNKLGQNFLIDLNQFDVLIRAAELGPNDLALEVGTGTGSLTQKLVETAGAVLSVELDPSFHSLAMEILEDKKNVYLIHQDVLKNKNQLRPEVLSALDEARRKHPELTLKMVANLPYAVATPAITNFLMSDYPFERFVVTVQYEIGERLVATPGNKDYNSLSILVQSLADTSIVRKLPPSVFWPQPKVDSAIVLIKPDAEKRAQVPNIPRFRAFLRDLYTQRRKNLRGGLTGLPSGRIPKAEVDAKLAHLQINGNVRAETLSIEDHLRLCEMFYAEK